MGYCHFWYRPVEIEEETFQAIVKDVELANVELAKKRIPIKKDFINEDTDEIMNECLIAEGYETFFFPRILPERYQQGFAQMKDGRFFQFVKTNKRPFDLSVKIALIIIKHHLKEQLIVTSDGYDWEWADASEFTLKQLGYPGNYQLDQSPGFGEMKAEFQWSFVDKETEV